MGMVDIILIGGPAHGSVQQVEVSISQPAPDTISAKVPLKVDSAYPSGVCAYKVTGLTVDEEPAAVAIAAGLSGNHAWPIALHEVRRFRESQGSTIGEVDNEAGESAAPE